MLGATNLDEVCIVAITSPLEMFNGCDSSSCRWESPIHAALVARHSDLKYASLLPVKAGHFHKVRPGGGAYPFDERRPVGAARGTVAINIIVFGQSFLFVDVEQPHFRIAQRDEINIQLIRLSSLRVQCKPG
jgi:hypothetical protein